MSGSQFFLPKQQNVDTNGNPLAGAKLYFYEVGTTTPKDVYQDEDFGTPHSVPVIADSDGRFDPIFMDGAYKVVFKDSADTTIWTQAEWSGITNLFNDVVDITADTNLNSTHKFQLLRCAPASTNITINLLAASTAGEGFIFGVYNDTASTYTVTLDGSGAETVNNAASITLGVGESAILVSTGTEWLALNVQLLDIAGLTTDTAPDITADYLAAADTSGSANSKVLMQTLLTKYISGLMTLSASVNWNSGVLTPGIYNTSGTTYAGTLPLGSGVEHTGSLVVLGGNGSTNDIQQIWYNGATIGVWHRMTTDGGSNWTTWKNNTVQTPEFGGRLTLTSAVPVLVSDVTAATTIYYALYKHDKIPLYDGTQWNLTTFTELSNITSNSATGSAGPAAVGNNSNYDLFVWNNSGTVTLTRGPAWTSDTARGTGAGTTELERVNGIWVNKIAISNGPAAQRGTYVGTVRSNGSAQIDVKFGVTPAAGGSAAVIGLWNMYNRVPVLAATYESTDSWTYTTSSFQQFSAAAAANNDVSFIRGLNEEPVSAVFTAKAQADTAGDAIGIGIGLDSITAATGRPMVLECNTANRSQELTASYDGIPGLGYHYLAALEYGSTTVTFYGDGGSATTIQSGMVVNTTW